MNEAEVVRPVEAAEVRLWERMSGLWNWELVGERERGRIRRRLPRSVTLVKGNNQATIFGPKKCVLYHDAPVGGLVQECHYFFFAFLTYAGEPWQVSEITFSFTNGKVSDAMCPNDVISWELHGDKCAVGELHAVLPCDEYWH